MKTARRFLMYGIPKTLLLKIILFLVILLIGKNVFAQDFNVTSSITSPIGGGRTGTYTGTEIYNTGSTTYYNVNTRYNGTLSRIIFNIPLPASWPDGDCFSSGDLVYTLTLNMATEDWRNHFITPFISGSSSGTNWATSSVVFVSYKKIYFTFKIPFSDNTCYDYLYLDLKSPSISNTAFTGYTNWNLSSVVLSVNFPSGSGGSGGSSPTPTPTGSDSQNIINNQNSNTQDLIDNQNSNTQNIIENNNNNTQSIINNQNSLFGNCKYQQISSYINSDLISTSDYYYQTSDIDIQYFKKGTYYWGFNVNQLNLGSYSSLFSTLLIFYSDGTPYQEINITYNTNKSYVSNSFTVNSDNVSRVYFRFLRSYTSGGQRSGKFTNIFIGQFSDPDDFNFGSQRCSSKIDDTNNTITNDSVDSGTGSDFFNNFSTSDNGGISGIITKPLVLINSLLSNNDSCSDLTFGIQFPGLQSKNVSFPSGCTLWNNVPSAVVNLYQVFIVGFSSYYLLKRLFKDVEDLKNPEKDEVEVIDL